MSTSQPNRESSEPNFQSFSSINGRVDAPLSVLDRGLAYGDGLFETMRLERGRLPFWSFHRERLLADSARLAIHLDPDVLEGYLQNVLLLAQQRGADKGIIKLTVTRGVAGRGYQPTDGVDPTVILSVLPLPFYPPSYFEEGVDVYVCDHRLPDNPALAGIKHLNKLDHVLAALEWRHSNCREGLLLDRHNHLVEAGSRNVFVVKRERLFTPFLNKAGVAGVLRRRIMEDYAKRLGSVVEEASLDREDLMMADEVFLTNSVLGVWPVKCIRGRGMAALRLPATDVARHLHRLFENDIQAGLEQRGT